MNSRKKFLVFSATFVFAVICFGLAKLWSARDIERGEVADGIAPEPQAAQVATKRAPPTISHAAAVVRAQSISRFAEMPKSASPPVTAPRKSTVSSANESTKAPPRKAATELVAQFIDDHPAEVFVPDTVRYHAAVDGEAVDPAWGPQTQSAMQDFLSSHLDANDGVELISADCRTDLCELDVVMTNTNGERFDGVMRAMKREPWWDQLELDQGTITIAFIDGRSVIIQFYSRK